MAFMTPDIYYGAYAIIEHADGSTECVPSAYAADVADNPEHLEYRTGYLGRLSGDGYLDCTDWTPLQASDDDAAVAELCNDEDICPVCFEQCWDEAETECEGSK